MDSRAMWMRMKAHGWAYTLSILATLARRHFDRHGRFLRSEGEGRAESVVTPLPLPSRCRRRSRYPGLFADRQAVGAERRQHQHRIDDQESASAPRWAEGDGRRRQGGGMDDFFNHFFGAPAAARWTGRWRRPIRERSLGSGVIVDPKGYIVTNRHVVEKADRIRVRFRTIRRACSTTPR